MKPKKLLGYESSYVEETLGGDTGLRFDRTHEPTNQDKLLGYENSFVEETPESYACLRFHLCGWHFFQEPATLLTEPSLPTSD
jgi:hypothetical protein